MPTRLRPMLTEGNTHLGQALWTFSIPALSTCLGATFACVLACYALRFRFWVKDTLAAHQRNWERSLEPSFAREASLDNVYAWWSEDRDSGPCPLPVGRRCFLCTSPADEARVPPGVQLVFRDYDKPARKWVGPAWVCPKEQGVPHGLTCSTCRRCFEPGPMPRRVVYLQEDLFPPPERSEPVGERTRPEWLQPPRYRGETTEGFVSRDREPLDYSRGPHDEAFGLDDRDEREPAGAPEESDVPGLIER